MCINPRRNMLGALLVMKITSQGLDFQGLKTCKALAKWWIFAKLYFCKTVTPIQKGKGTIKREDESKKKEHSKVKVHK